MANAAAPSAIVSRSPRPAVFEAARAVEAGSPNDYLKDLFTRLPAAKITQIKEFSPVASAKGKKKALADAA